MTFTTKAKCVDPFNVNDLRQSRLTLIKNTHRQIGCFLLANDTGEKLLTASETLVAIALGEV